MAHFLLSRMPTRKRKRLKVPLEKSASTENRVSPSIPSITNDDIEWELTFISAARLQEFHKQLSSGRKKRAMLKPISQIAPDAITDVGINPRKQTAFPPAVATVGTASILILNANNNRTGLVLINLSANNVSFGIGVSALISCGITLTPNGVWEMDPFTFCLDEIYAVASGAGSLVSIQEFS